MINRILVLLLLCCVQLGALEDKTVMLAVLARNKAHTLPKYLKCIEELDYEKKLISIYINTNDNEDGTAEILTQWVSDNKDKYRSIELEDYHVPGNPTARPHEWTGARFKILGGIREKSLQKTKELNCDYYFVVDCDNFIVPWTLKELLAQDKPIIAPLLKAVPELNDAYSNYFCAVDAAGYYAADPDYYKILNGQMRGTFKVPVVHCTYLIRAEYLDKLGYVDESHDYEFVIFSKKAREANVDQYICNVKEFGTLLHFHKDLTLEEEKNRFKDAQSRSPEHNFNAKTQSRKEAQRPAEPIITHK